MASEASWQAAPANRPRPLTARSSSVSRMPRPTTRTSAAPGRRRWVTLGLAGPRTGSSSPRRGFELNHRHWVAALGGIRMTPQEVMPVMRCRCGTRPVELTPKCGDDQRDHRKNPVEHLRSEREDDLRSRWSYVVWWACQDLNLGPHPYQQSRAERHADRCFPGDPRTSRAKLSSVPRCSRQRDNGSYKAPNCDVGGLPVADKARGLPWVW